jgi:hypothetical protein
MAFSNGYGPHQSPKFRNRKGHFRQDKAITARFIQFSFHEVAEKKNKFRVEFFFSGTCP